MTFPKKTIRICDTMSESLSDNDKISLIVKCYRYFPEQETNASIFIPKYAKTTTNSANLIRANLI